MMFCNCKIFLYQLVYTTALVIATDVDECVESVLELCAGDDDICINTRGGYVCQTIRCPAGFVKAPPAASYTADRHRFVSPVYVCQKSVK